MKTIMFFPAGRPEAPCLHFVRLENGVHRREILGELPEIPAQNRELHVLPGTEPAFLP